MVLSRAALLLALAASLPVAADTQKKATPSQAEAAQKTADIKYWLKYSGVVAIQVDNAKKTLQGSRRVSSKEIPDAFWEDFEKSITYEAFEAPMVEAYEKAFTAQELREYIKLLDNPVFRKFQEKDRKVQQELVGPALRKVMEDTSKRLMQKHKIEKGAPKAPAKKG